MLQTSRFDSELECKLTAINMDGLVTIQFPDSLPDALRSELIMSLIQPKEFSLSDETDETAADEEKRSDAVDLFEEVRELFLIKVHLLCGTVFLKRPFLVQAAFGEQP